MVLHLSQGWGLAHVSVQDLSSPLWLKCQRGTQVPARGLSSHSAQASARDPGAAEAQSARGDPGTGAREEGRTGPVPNQSPIPGRDQSAVRCQRGSAAPSRPRCQQSPAANAGPQLPLRPSAARARNAGPPRSQPRCPRVPPSSGPAASGRETPALRSALRPEPRRPGAALPESLPLAERPRGLTRAGQCG